MVDLRTLRGVAGFACLVVIAGACGADRASPAPASPHASAASPQAVAAKCVIDGTVRGPTGAPAVGALVAVVVPNAPTEAAIVHTTEGGAFCVEGAQAILVAAAGPKADNIRTAVRVTGSS